MRGAGGWPAPGAGQAAARRCGAVVDSQALQNLALRQQRAGLRRPVAARASASKSTCAVRSASPGCASGSVGRMPLHRLQGVAQRMPAAIVEDQRRAAWPGDPGGDLVHHRRRRRGKISTRSPSRVSASRGGSAASGAALGQPQGQRSPSTPTTRSRQPRAVRGELADRQRVEEFVGDQEQRQRRQVGGVVVPGDGATGSAACCRSRRCAEASTRCTCIAACEARHVRRGAQHIGHQGAAAGPELGQREGRRRALIQPGLRQAQPDQLAEHLADLGRGGEIAGSAEGIAGGVIAVARDAAGIRPCSRQRSSARRRRSAAPAGRPARSRRPPGVAPQSDQRQPDRRSSAATATGPWSGPSRRRRSTWPCGLPGVMNCASASAEEFDDEAGEAIAGQEQAGVAQGRFSQPPAADRQPQHQAQHQPLQPGFVKLRRMPGAGADDAGRSPAPPRRERSPPRAGPSAGPRARH